MNVVKVESFVMTMLIVQIRSEILLVLVIRALMEMVSTALVITTYKNKLFQTYKFFFTFLQMSTNVFCQMNVMKMPNA